MTIRRTVTGTMTVKFRKTLEFNDQAELDDFRANEESNLLCNVETDDITEIDSLEDWDWSRP